MVWQLLAENKIQEAIEQGLFDDLPGKGKPLDLSAYFDTPAAERAGFSVLKTAGVVPPEVEMLKTIEKLQNVLASATDPEKRNALLAKLNSLQTACNMTMERRRLSARGNRGLEGSLIG
jgi:hypothetical protein